MSGLPGTALGYDTRCLLHDNGSMVVDRQPAGWIEVDHAENANRVERAYAVLAASGVLARLEVLPTREATIEELLLVHTEAHVEWILEACAKVDAPAAAGHPEVMLVGPEARVGRGSNQAALIAAGTAIEAVDHVCRVDSSQPAATSAHRAYSLTRPPGHHASAGQAMGFCLFNNAALAVRHSQLAHGVERVAVLDWDVHHGNGTQAVFYEDPNVLFISLHQDGLYPSDEGLITERGAGEGVGANVNVPLPAGTGDAGYLAALEQVALPAIADFDPGLIVLSSGQDAGACDPLGRMSVTAEGFRAMTADIVALAEESCEGRIVAIQEGGYSLDHMPFCVLATVEVLAGLEASLAADPVEMDVPKLISPAETEAIRNAARAAGIA
ncbi:MAG: class II histone deacetylase [Solirubrobacterales bacterium]